MSKYLRSVVTLSTDSGLPEDKIVNVMHWIGADFLLVPTSYNELADRINTFYANIDAVLSATLTNTMKVELYDLKDGEPRIPVYEETYTNLTPAATSLPTEVALCVSFEGLEFSGLDQRNRRGRIFVGPIAISESVVLDGRARPSTGLINLLGPEMASMAKGPTDDDFRLAVFSPTIAKSLDPLMGALTETTLVASTTPVTKIWIDNAWDTQRRRGTDASLRTTFTPT